MTAMTDPIIAAARFLDTHLDWLRHRSPTEIRDCYTDITAAARIINNIATGPQEQRYLGPCGADISIGTLSQPDLTYACDGDVYGRPGAETGRCRTCGATVNTDDRRAWLDDLVRQHAYYITDIADAYHLNIKTLRDWTYNRPDRYDHSGTRVQTARPAKLQPHTHDRDNRPLYLVGDVLDLAATEAARREERRAQRERLAAKKTERITT